MLDELFSSPRARARSSRSWLRGPIEDFLKHLAAQRYNRSTLRVCSYSLLAFGEFTAAQGIRQTAALPQWVDPFVAQIHAQDCRRRKVRLALLRFLGYLRQTNVIPGLQTPPPPDPHTQLIDDYLGCLREQRGLCPDTLALIRQPCLALLVFADAEGIANLRSLSPDIIHRFLTAQGNQYSRRTLQSRCSALRGFLSYLHRRGVVSVDWAAAVVAPRVYKHEQCPRFLTRAEIDAVLAVIDRQTSLGRRDYAMVLLLAVYGLRGIEVIHLRLDDIDWRRQLLHIRGRKAGNDTTYPLSVSAGEAIVAYLQDGRPASPHREVFLTIVAPFTPLVSSDGLANQVKKYLAKAEFRVERPGTHSFRYSCAQRLFDRGMTLKAIGDYLGHRDTNVTQRYTKIALEQLREVAMGDGEDLL
jgi:site-specific recombinase XerD